MLRHAFVTLALITVNALPVRAVELIAGWSFETLWESNVLRSSVNEESDFSFLTGPVVRLRQPQGDLEFDLEYRPSYEAFVKLDGINEFEHFAEGELTWHMTPRTEFSIADDFAISSRITTIFDAAQAAEAGVAVLDRQRIRSNRGSARLTHRLDRLWEFSAELDNQIFDYENERQSDTAAWSGTVQVTRAITPRLIAGIGASAQRQDFQGVEVAGFGQTPDTGTTILQGFGLVTYQISKTWSASVSAGPAWANPDSVDEAFAVSPLNQDPTTGERPLLRDRFNDEIILAPGEIRFIYDVPIVCPPQSQRDCPVFAPAPANLVEAGTEPFVGQGAESSLTYFANLSLEKTWQRWRASASYRRSASNASGIGTSTLVDAVSATLLYTPTEKWRISLSGGYSKQTALSEARQRVPVLEPLEAVLGPDGRYRPGRCPSGPADADCFQAIFGDVVAVTSGGTIDNAVDFSTARIELRALRRISKRFRVLGTAAYFRQKNEGALQRSATTDLYQVSLRFVWELEPIPL